MGNDSQNKTVRLAFLATLARDGGENLYWDTGGLAKFLGIHQRSIQRDLHQVRQPRG